MSTVRAAVIERLADGSLHSGAALADELGVSRAAIGRQVAVLRRQGWQITGQVGLGYRLERSATQPLDRTAVVAELAPQSARVRSVDVVTEIGSTNDYLRDRAFACDGAADVCLAEHQTAGRGRRGRPWRSQPGQGIAVSLGRLFQRGPGELTVLGIATGVAVAESLRLYGLDRVALKWPNDIVVGDAKLGGILVEVEGEADGPTAAILGIGLNYVQYTAVDDFDQDVTAIVDELPNPPPRDHLAGAIVANVVAALDQFAEAGFDALGERWGKFDSLCGRPVRVHVGTGRIVHGVAEGIDHDGALRVATTTGVQRFLSGDVSVRV